VSSALPQPQLVDPAADSRLGLATALVGADGCWRSADPGLAELLGRPEDDLLGRPVSEAIEPEDLAPEWARMEHLLAGHLIAYRSEIRLRHAAGHVFWGRLDASAVLDRSGAPAWALLQLQDVSERKRFELWGTRWILGAADLDRGSTLISVKDAQGRYLRINRRFAEFFSIPEAELEGRDDRYLVPDSIAALMRGRDRLALAAAPGWREGRERVPQPGGPAELVGYRFALVGARGRPYALCTIWSPPQEGDAARETLDRLFVHEGSARERAAAGHERQLELERDARVHAPEAQRQALDALAAETPGAALAAAG
jgi:PAS domain S-box-containing protein